MSVEDTTPSRHAMTRLEASRLLGERDALPKAERKRISKATLSGRALDDARERDIQRAALLEGRGSRRMIAVGMVIVSIGMMLSLWGSFTSGDGPGLRDVLDLGALLVAPFLAWQLWRQRSLERRLGPTPETDPS